MDWLPDELKLPSNSLESDYSILFEVFEKDFANSEMYLGDDKVLYQRAIDRKTPPGIYPHGFTHLVTRENGGQRIIDYDRAVRLPWARAIIEHADDPAITVLKTIKNTAKRGPVETTYLWLEDKDFLIVLSKVERGVYTGQSLTTAYTLTEEYAKKRLYKLKAEAQEKEKRPWDVSRD